MPQKEQRLTICIDSHNRKVLKHCIMFRFPVQNTPLPLDSTLNKLSTEIDGEHRTGSMADLITVGRMEKVVTVPKEQQTKATRVQKPAGRGPPHRQGVLLRDPHCLRLDDYRTSYTFCELYSIPEDQPVCFAYQEVILHN